MNPYNPCNVVQEPLKHIANDNLALINPHVCVLGGSDQGVERVGSGC